MAKLYFSYAAMNAGKSTILLQASYNYRERGMRTLLFTSSLYANTDHGWITSRIGVHAGAELYDQEADLYAWVKREHRAGKIDCVFVDEAQFLTADQVWQLARVADGLGIPVLCFGLRTDFQGKLFPGSSELLAIADSLREVRTICHCGSKATMVVRQAEDGTAIMTGDQIAIDKSVYISLCRRHWAEATGRWLSPEEEAKAEKAGRKAEKKARKKAKSKTSKKVVKLDKAREKAGAKKKPKSSDKASRKPLKVAAARVEKPRKR